jgi:hypothetical protein
LLNLRLVDFSTHFNVEIQNASGNVSLSSQRKFTYKIIFNGIYSSFLGEIFVNNCFGKDNQTIGSFSTVLERYVMNPCGGTAYYPRGSVIDRNVTVDAPNFEFQYTIQNSHVYNPSSNPILGTPYELLSGQG